MGAAPDKGGEATPTGRTAGSREHDTAHRRRAKGDGRHSLRAPARENCRERLQQDSCVERERPLVDVLKVERHPIVEAQVAAAADLPESCDPLRNTEAPNEPCFAEVGEVASRQRTWPDERHISLEDVQELRQLVERELPQ